MDLLSLIILSQPVKVELPRKSSVSDRAAPTAAEIFGRHENRCRVPNH